MAGPAFSLQDISVLPADRGRPQAKLLVGRQDDRWELEADRVADRVTRMPDAEARTRTRTPPSRAAGGPGTALPSATQEFMESRFGHDFGGVRIHAGARADGLCRRLGARAFTLGSDVFFSATQFRPETHEGRRLLAHELTHVVQQSAAPRAQAGRAGTGPPPVGQGRVGRRIQRRTGTPTRSDKTQTFTYPLRVYTIDEETFQEAQAVADKLNGFTGKVWDNQGQAEYTVRFAVTVLRPPKAEFLEKEFGINLHYRIGRKRVKKRKYRKAAQRWWVQVLQTGGDTGNLYLGQNKPIEETQEYIRASARAADQQRRQDLLQEFRRRNQAAKQANPEAAKDPDWIDPESKTWYRKEIAKLDKEGPIQAIDQRLDDPFAVEGSRGTTFAGTVVQMRAPRGSPGTPAFQQNIRLHEFMHLMGLSQDFTTLHKSIMSYPNLLEHKSKETILMPEQDDIDLLYQDNPPSAQSVD